MIQEYQGWLPNAPLVMEHDNNRYHRAISVFLNITPIHTNSYIFIHIHTNSYIFIHIHTYSYIFIHIHTNSYIFTYNKDTIQNSGSFAWLRSTPPRLLLPPLVSVTSPIVEFVTTRLRRLPLSLVTVANPTLSKYVIWGQYDRGSPSLYLLYVVALLWC